MNVLLDTHVLLWWLADSEHLGAGHRQIIADRRNGVWVSSATVWEIGIKRALGKVDAPDDLAEVLAGTGFEQLSIRWRHADAAGRLPLHHRDPFDRILIAQAITEGLTFATADQSASMYEVATV
jgi:PIN domain nuclease of toxin-antitoxin system